MQPQKLRSTGLKKEADVSKTLRGANNAPLSAALLIPDTATHTTHAHATAAKFWATKNFAAYGLRGTWSSIR
jgi:hypothetical protein